jgi:hypothetical protein
MRSESTGRVVPKTCKSWLCPWCNVWLREGARKLIVSGMRTRPPGYDLALFTFTEPARATLDLKGLAHRWKATKKRLQRRGWIGAHCRVTEWQKRGALHPHIVAHVPIEICERMWTHGDERRTRDQYRWHFNELVPMARELGWGPVCDARAAAASNELAAYTLKSLANYATKEAYVKFKEAGAERIRPINSSRDWAPAILREFQRGEKATDPGPWLDVTTGRACG